MSFFKDFKADLSQAVNELLPEENLTSSDIMSEEPQMVDTISEAAALFEKSEEPELVMPDLSVFDDASVMEQPVMEEPAAEPVFTEPAPAPVVTPEPVVEPVFTEPAPAPVVTPEPVAEPVFTEPAPAPVATPAPAPVPTPEPVAETPKVEPIFSQPTSRPAPINTTMEDFSMETGIIISGMSVKGDIASEGSLDVRGSVNGNITIKGKLEVTGTIEGNSTADEVFADGAQITGEVHSNGSVKIGQGAVVKGNITATSAVLAGAVKGDIDVQGPVILDTTAIIMGNIKSKSIQINNGAVIEGLCSQCYADVSPMSFFGEDKKSK